MEDDATPELPDTQDPFELLGLDEELADQREAKRAYARLIKIHRPDRAPEAFRRIHAAFDEVKRRLAGAAAAHAPVAEPAPERELPAREPYAPTPEPEPDLRAIDADQVFERLDAAFAAGEIAAVHDALSDRAMVAAAMVDADLASVCLSAIAGLAWRGEKAQALFWDYTQGPSASQLGSEIDRIELDLRTATIVRASKIALPAPIRKLLEDSAIAESARARGLRENVDKLLSTSREEVLSVLDEIAATEPKVAEALCWWCAAYSPWGTPALAELPRGTFQALTSQLVSLGKVHTVGGVMPWIMRLTFDFFAEMIKLALWLTAPWRYRRGGRRALALVIALVGVPAECVRSWIAANRRLAPALARYEPRIAGDGGLRLLGHIAWLVHPQQRLHAW